MPLVMDRLPSPIAIAPGKSPYRILISKDVIYRSKVAIILVVIIYSHFPKHSELKSPRRNLR